MIVKITTNAYTINIYTNFIKFFKDIKSIFECKISSSS